MLSMSGMVMSTVMSGPSNSMLQALPLSESEAWHSTMGVSQSHITTLKHSQIFLNSSVT